jgi:hypothetical protein
MTRHTATTKAGMPGRSVLKRRLTLLRKDLAAFEEIERGYAMLCGWDGRAPIKHNPERDKWAADRLAAFKSGIDTLVKALAAIAEVNQ